MTEIKPRKGLEIERYKYLNVITMQRLAKDMLWYAVFGEQIIDFDQYRHDLEERVREMLCGGRK